MLAAVLASAAVEIVPSMALFAGVLAIGRVEPLIGISIAGAVLALVLRGAVLVGGLRMALRPSRGVPWLAIAVAIILALVSYPVSVGLHAVITHRVAHMGVRALAEWSMTNAYVSAAAGFAHALLGIAVLALAARMWSQRR